MPLETTTYEVFIASPSDCAIERDLLSRAILEWNTEHTLNTRAVMLPVRWEADAVPMGGQEPQQLINTQLLSRCDLLIGVFRLQLGRTRGTVREIDYFVDNGRARRVMVYTFDPLSVPGSTVKADSALTKYMSTLQRQLLTHAYTSPEHLTQLVKLHLSRRIDVTLATPYIAELRQTLAVRIKDWNSITIHSRDAGEEACTCLELAVIALQRFTARPVGRPLNADGTARACERFIEVLVAERETFILATPWQQAEQAMAMLTTPRDELPNRDDLL
jgi:hypothetical protein